MVRTSLFASNKETKIEKENIVIYIVKIHVILDPIDYGNKEGHLNASWISLKNLFFLSQIHFLV